MPEWPIRADSVEEAVRRITHLLEDTSHKAIYWDGWDGLGASTVLRAIAQHPPRSLKEKFGKIIHINCSRWKSRRALQRAIAEELKLPQGVMAVFDTKDEEDDFSGVDEGSRAEIADVGKDILAALLQYRCLVVFHNGSNDMVDLIDLGIPQPLFGTKVLWTFRGRLRLNRELKEKVDDSHLYLYKDYLPDANALLQEEAREIARYVGKPSVTPEIVAKCCSYLLALNHKGGNMMDYDWAMHASNYWVCDGIIEIGQDNNEEAWDDATTLHQELRLEDYSSNRLPSFGDELHTPPNRWIFLVTNSFMEQRAEINVPTVPLESTSFFLTDDNGPDPPLASLPDDMFHQSDKLRVLKLCCYTFSFTSPPFHCCRSLRFLGLDSCKDQPREQEEKQQRPAMEFFQSLWVLDICYTDWELALSPEIIEQMATNIREVHIKKGRIWGSNLAWRHLRNLRKLRVIEPTCPWETGDMDEFIVMGKLELLDLSRNSTMQVLPNLSGAIGLKTLVLDGCVGLDHVGPEGLPPFLESFSLDAGVGEDHKKAATISHVSLVGCERLVNFILRGSLPNLQELDLSSTSVKTLDLTNKVVHVPSLHQMVLLGCEKLRSILWPAEGLPQLRVLCIASLVCRVRTEHHQAYATIMDVGFVQSLVLKSCDKFCWNDDRFRLNMRGPSTNKDDKIGPYNTGQKIGQPQQNLLFPNPSYRIYTDVTIDNRTSDHDDNNAHQQFQPLDSHLEIGEGFSYTKNMESEQGIKATIFVMNKVKSLHVHDNSSIAPVIPERTMSVGGETIVWHHLKQCRVERCPKLHTVFPSDYDDLSRDYRIFRELETFWAADLPMAHCIWSKGWAVPGNDKTSFKMLQSIHLYYCPKLVFVLPLVFGYERYLYLPNLETLHIIYCGDLRQVFPVEPEFLNRIATDDRKKGILQFPKLKHIHLHQLPKLQQICEAKMCAPMLETIKVRGCWGLRRLPAVGRDSCTVVDCEKDWWGKLEWDGLHVGHDPSLFNLRHSQYYKKPLPRGSVLR